MFRRAVSSTFARGLNVQPQQSQRIVTQLVRNASTTARASGSRNGFLKKAAFIGIASVGIGAYYLKENEAHALFGFFESKKPKAHPHDALPVVWKDVKKDIVELIDRENCGPLLVRLGWHASGTYDKIKGAYGSAGATMRFKPELSDPANAGLDKAQQMLVPIKNKYPNLSFADIWTFAAAVAVENAGGPPVEWKDGRVDLPSAVETNIPANGALPAASDGPSHIRNVFYRMGFNDREIVALLGAHTLGECHKDRSGYTGPWTRDPNGFDNSYYTLLLEEKWSVKMNYCPVQFESADGTLMMLPADLALITDPKFREYVVLYAKSPEIWYQDFAAAFAKLLENGVPRTKPSSA